MEGPVAIRHMVNPSSGKDEGLRLVWPCTSHSSASPRAAYPPRSPARSLPHFSTTPIKESNNGLDLDIELRPETEDAQLSMAALQELQDWPRRDRLIRQGRTVHTLLNDQYPALPYTPFHPSRNGPFDQHTPALPWVLPMGLGFVSPCTTLSPLSPLSPISPVSPATFQAGLYARAGKVLDFDVGECNGNEYMSVSE